MRPRESGFPLAANITDVSTPARHFSAYLTKPGAKVFSGHCRSLTGCTRMLILACWRLSLRTSEPAQRENTQKKPWRCYTSFEVMLKMLQGIGEYHWFAKFPSYLDSFAECWSSAVCIEDGLPRIVSAQRLTTVQQDPVAIDCTCGSYLLTWMKLPKPKCTRLLIILCELSSRGGSSFGLNARTQINDRWNS